MKPKAKPVRNRFVAPFKVTVPKALPEGVILYGQDVTLESQTENFNGRASGIQTVDSYAGDPAAIRELRDRFIEEDIRYRYSANVPGRIEVYRDEQIDGDSGSTTLSKVVETWDLDWVQVNVRASFAPCFRAGTAVEMAVLATERFIDSYNPETDTPWQSIDFNTKYSGARANLYRDARALGVEDYETFRPVIIQRISAASTAEIAASNTGINKVWKVDPKSSLNKLGNLSEWQFRKLPARKSTFDGKISIEQRWDGATLWEPNMYPLYNPQA